MVASIAASLGLGELGLRGIAGDDFLREPISDWGWHRTDPLMVVGLQPGHRDALGVEVNALGFRGPALEPGKPAGTLRIACLGDSSTFGITRTDVWGQEFSAYPQFLREIATERGRPDLEIINAGVMGYTAAHGLRQLNTRLRPLDPDILVARFGMNDHNWLFEWRKLAEPRTRLGRWLMYRFHDWRLGELGAFFHTRFDPFKPATSALMEQALDEFTRNLDRIAEVASVHGRRLAFLDYPLRPRRRGAPDPEFRPSMLGARRLDQAYALHRAFQRGMHEVASRHEVPVIVTAQALRELDEPAFTDFDLVHPSRAGKREIARVVYEALEELGWLDRR